MNAVDLGLDYFQIYELERPVDVSRAGELVALQGQFDEEAEKARPVCMIRFADRVRKNNEELYDKNAHLTWYRLGWRTDPRVIRHVTIANQFTKEQELEIHQVIGLLVPARMRTGHRRAFSKETRLDHYKVYEAFGPQVDAPPIELEDQFHRRQTRVYYPVAFAVPVWKEHKERFDILNEKAHLTIYRVDTSRDLPIVIDTLDQFFPLRGLKLGVSRLLAVPSKKLDWKEG